ncbi:hypothetical protein [Kaistella yonginensis]|uniref:hypothetical protein n=1 Tax=Kaistella yonginensis TaxID=658267 RepID=UPI0025B5261F|nr:hypothetical protein [Kaistella yonginensis]MDN3606396.1 hypothetical protein [Kaistella yonginensis]
MPSTIANQSLGSMSNSGRNVRGELYAESYFFLEKNKAYSQTAENKFGIIGHENSKFSTTSKITFSGTVKVFSIAQGQIFLQPNSKDSEKINLILKPFRQPISGLGIRYIVYRGLMKSDFMDENLKINQEGVSATGFVNHVQKEFKDFYKLINQPAPEFTAEFLGYPVQESPQPEIDLIDNYFFKISKINEENGETTESQPFDFPITPAGTFLGNADGELGIDIVLNEGNYHIENDPNPFQLNLSYARASGYILDPSPYTGIQEKLIKETSTQFIDVAAFYGLHTYGKGKIKVFSGNQETILQDENEISDLLDSFNTKNTIYLYIQSNRQRSYNFYENYNLNEKNMKIGTDADHLQEKQFGTDGWPVEILYNSSDSETLLVSLINNKNYFDKIFYIDIGNPQEENKDVLFIKELKNISNKERDYLEAVNFKINKTSGIIKLLYIGENIDEPYLTIEPYFLDKHHNVVRELYPLINVKSFLDLEGNLTSISFNKKSFINLNSFSELQSMSVINNSIFFYEGKKQEEDDFLYKEKVLFLAKKEDTIDSNLTNNRDLIFGTRSSMITNIPRNNEASFLMMKLYGDRSYRYYYNEIKDSSKTIKLLKLKLNEEIDTTYFSVGILKEEYEKLMQIIPAGAASNVKLYLDEEEQNPLLDDETHRYYFKYSLGINYEDENGTLQILFPNVKIYVYGEGISLLASSGFVEYEYPITLENEKRWTIGILI